MLGQLTPHRSAYAIIEQGETTLASEWIIGALAFITIGGVLGISIFHFGYHLKDPKNMEATKRVVADRESAATAVSTEGVDGRSLRQRLDQAPKINERLGNRPTGMANAWDLLFNTKYSTLRAMLKGDSKM